MRNAEVIRKTQETDIELWLELDGTGKSEINTGVGFLDHMLTLLAKHAGFDLVVRCEGDTYVDDHHTVEDIGICLGRAFSEAIGEKRGIRRYGDTILPMDEALILTAVDISGRATLVFELDLRTEKVGTFDTELVEEFLLGFVRNAGLNLHVRQLAGKNSHHIIEGTFKSLARTLREAVEIDERFREEIPSTKGTLREEPNEIELDYNLQEASEETEEPVSVRIIRSREPDDYLEGEAQADEDAFDGEPYDEEEETSVRTFTPSYDEDEEEAYADAFDGEPYEEEEDEGFRFEGTLRAKDDTYQFVIPDAEEEEEPESAHIYRRYDTFDYSDYDGDGAEDDVDHLAESLARASLKDGKTQVAMNWKEDGEAPVRRHGTGLDGTLVHKSSGLESKGLADENYSKGIVKELNSTAQLEQELIEQGLL